MAYDFDRFFSIDRTGMERVRVNIHIGDINDLIRRSRCDDRSKNNSLVEGGDLLRFLQHVASVMKVLLG